MAFCTSVCEEGRQRDVLLLFQNEIGICSGLDGRSEVCMEPFNHNLMVKINGVCHFR